MPVDIPTLAGVPYNAQQAIYRLREALDVLELRPSQDAAALAKLAAAQARQDALIQQLVQQLQAAQAERRAQESGGGGGGGGGGGPNLGVPLANLSSVVQAYAAANPAQLANSCLAQGGNWDFMDGCVAALMAADPRVGWCGQRGDPDDTAEDAICYWGLETMPPQPGQQGNYVVDIISGHCGPSPGHSWNSVTPAGAVWLPVRSS